MKPGPVIAAASAWVLAIAPAPAAPDGAGQVQAPAGGLRERSAAGTAQAQYELGIALLCVRPPRPEEAARWMTQAAEQGHRGAQSVLGWLYMSGRGVKHDDRTAARWLRLAAQGGDAAAQNNLGVLYAVGGGVEHDHLQAERWFRAAADQGAADAQRNLAVLGGTARGAAARLAARPAVHPALSVASCRRLAPLAGR